MKFIVACSLFLFSFLSTQVCAQQMKALEPDAAIVEAVKKDVWVPFMESYRDLDFSKLKSIHSSKVTRVSVDMNKINFGEPYLNEMGGFFKQIKQLNYQMQITFSIVSSATTKDTVYQTGYYTIGLRKNDQTPFQTRGYSSFSVLLTKENGKWKISFDADKKTNVTKEEFEKGVVYSLG
ncbi:hypothetical protein [Pseudotenacibaculum haliotis]|uniref:Nuclear transport factor 2 family protein n=1 Tax=Pseudotenacibaculum haliotis TaxID=1862138 RepID=A0ABW5LYB4_9FLAO